MRRMEKKGEREYFVDLKTKRRVDYSVSNKFCQFSLLLVIMKRGKRRTKLLLRT